MANSTHVGPARWEERALIGARIGVIAVSMMGTAYFYGFNLNDSNLVVNARAIVLALVTDLVFFLSIQWANAFWIKKVVGFALLWSLIALGFAGFTWLNNMLFIGATWDLSQAAIDRVGIPSDWLLRLVAAFPPVVAVLTIVAPRRQEADSRTPQEILAEAKAARDRQAALAELNAAQAGGLRARLDRATSAAFKLDERKAKKAQEEQERLARRAEREQIEADHKRMRALATREEIEAASDNEDEELDYKALEQMLRDREVWPVAIPTTEKLIAQGVAAKKAANTESVYPIKEYYTAAELAKYTNKSERSIRERSSANYRGNNRIRPASKKGPRGERQFTRNTLELLRKEPNTNPEITATSQRNTSGEVGSVNGGSLGSQGGNVATGNTAEGTPTTSVRRVAKRTPPPTAEAVNE